MLDGDVVGGDRAAGAPHRVRLFSGNGEIDDADSPSGELARAVEEIDGRAAIRVIFRVDRCGRGGDKITVYQARVPLVPFTQSRRGFSAPGPTPLTRKRTAYG